MMRKILLLATFCLPILLAAQTQRTVLIQEWTNASCAPCASQNPDFNALLDANPDKVVDIKFQWYFPGYDPMHEQNPDEVNSLGEYYGLTGVPTAWIDGIQGDDSYGGGIGVWDIAGGGYEGGPYGFNQAVIDYAYSQTTPIAMTLEHSLNDDATQVTVNVTLTNMGTEDFTMADGRLQIALLEEDIVFAQAPGNNGEAEFSNVMRKMYPDANGTAVPTIAAGASMDFTVTGDIPNYIYSLAELRVAAYVQDQGSAEVWQSAITETQEIANGIDPGLGDNQTTAPVGLCGGTITPQVDITNNGTADITNAVVNALINGSVIEQVTYEGTLAPGSVATVSFAEVTLVAANSVLTFALEGANGGVGVDINNNNNFTAPVTYSTLSETAIGTELIEDNESYPSGSYPTIGLVNAPIPLGEFGGNSFTIAARGDLIASTGDPFGGYGESTYSMFINFYQWDPASTPSEGSIIYQKIDLAAAVSPMLSFDRASASYAGDGTSSDRLQVRISTDCGSTWTTIWNAQGADLNTAPASEPFYVPNAGDWATESFDLSAYIGEEVNIEFKAFSGWGNNLFIDNINISDLVATQELTEVTAIRLFPNPVKETMKVDFQLEEANQLQVEIFNAVGQKVQNLGATNFNTGHNQFDVNASDLSNGVYFLRMYNADKELNRRFVVQH